MTLLHSRSLTAAINAWRFKRFQTDTHVRAPYPERNVPLFVENLRNPVWLARRNDAGEPVNYPIDVATICIKSGIA